MRIHILGTAAAEGWPGLFCGCPTCNRARKAGGKDFRTRASVQIDTVYKIDLPPDTLCHTMRYGIDLSALKYLFFTHSHGDHFTPSEIEYLREGFSHDLQNAPVRVYAPPAVHKRIQPLTEQHPDIPIDLHEAKPFDPITADHLTFTPILASHASAELCVNYVIQSENATVLYTPDSGVYPRQTIDFISSLSFDVLILECTFGPTKHRPITHMNFKAVLDLRDRLARSGAVRADTRVILTHFSHNMGLLHAEFEELARPYGIEIAYDGMVMDCRGGRSSC